jgi:hypothetical protein
MNLVNVSSAASSSVTATKTQIPTTILMRCEKVILSSYFPRSAGNQPVWIGCQPSER